MTIKILDYELLMLKLEDILTVEEKVIHATGVLYDTKTWGRKEFMALRKDKDILSCAVMEEGFIAGFSIAYQFDTGYAHISRFAVSPEWTSRGYGSAMMDFQLKTMHERKYQKCSVDLINANRAARKLYESSGFVKLEGPGLSDYVKLKGRDEKEYLGPEPSHIAMIKYL